MSLKIVDQNACKIALGRIDSGTVVRDGARISIKLERLPTTPLTVSRLVDLAVFQTYSVSNDALVEVLEAELVIK